MSGERCEGWLLAGRYRLLGELGRGGMGTVWRAHDELLDREVAVKEVALAGPPGPARELAVERTMREARLAARLSHPHIAAVYDVVLADDRPWIVLQLVRSRSLAQVIAERGPLPVPDVARIGLQLLGALEAAHEAGVMHRDIKPANILFGPGGHAFLTDFGLASTLDEESSLTEAGIVVGTPAYIAPERAGGGRSVPASDLWSLGVTLYTAVEGRTPFGDNGGRLATISAVLTADPAPFCRAGLLTPLIGALLVKDPSERVDAVRARDELRRLVARYDGNLPAALPGGEEGGRPARPGRSWGAVTSPVAGRLRARTRRRLSPDAPAPRGLRVALGGAAGDGAHGDGGTLGDGDGFVPVALGAPTRRPLGSLGGADASAARPGAAVAALRARWREATAVTALVVSAVATTTWWNAAPEQPHRIVLSDPAPRTPEQSNGAMVARPMSNHRSGPPQGHRRRDDTGTTPPATPRKTATPSLQQQGTTRGGGPPPAAASAAASRGKSAEHRPANRGRGQGKPSKH
ncbi:serine/threonine-protein kinase [Nonomuraea pusilla]|uniref:non-specific serine/threonine protein kinase n=1 Tax=Nonomuraea pusilla TaxID=46177 RepID=A0A1H8H3W8_9ACTN|nr:serine/threonine-protein kinase [Nonomuraea pusilla]SEN51081.1 Serine/threonine protein kinase [Nonomuraea pusilla]